MDSTHSGKHLSSLGAETVANVVPGACGRAPVHYCVSAVTSERTELVVKVKKDLATLPNI